MQDICIYVYILIRLAIITQITLMVYGKKASIESSYNTFQVSSFLYGEVRVIRFGRLYRSIIHYWYIAIIEALVYGTESI